MKTTNLCELMLGVVLVASGVVCAQSRPATSPAAELRLSLVSSVPGKPRPVPAVLWLEPLTGTPDPPFVAHSPYTLMQKDRRFIPHLMVIPVGSEVRFPNADPFFHNVFSLFQGKRFDLGLYESGSSRSVTFSREGVSYIFCDIHPEMSAVILALSTPLYAIANANNSFVLRNVPSGDYMLHLWIESVPESFLQGLARPVHLLPRTADLGSVSAPIGQPRGIEHNDMYGHTYDKPSHPTY